MSRSLIITANYAASKLELPEAFLRSLRATGSNADVVIVANHGGQEDSTRLEKLMPGARLWVPIPKLRYRILRRIATTFPSLARWVAGRLRDAWMKQEPARRIITEHWAAHLLNITCARYFLARRLLHDSGQHFDQIMLADSRDVVFQRDPFAELPDGLTTGLESGLVKEQPANSEWLDILYGDEPGFPMEAIKEQKVICSGVTLGDTASVAGYLECICAEFMKKLPRMIHQPYLDQGAHIGLLRTGRIRGARLVSNGEDVIATLCTSDLSEFSQEPTGLILAANGRPVSIVHQYDRHPRLSEKLLSALFKDSKTADQ